MLPLLSAFAAIPPGAILAVILVFVRIGAISALLPGLGEAALPLRVKLTAAVAMTAIVWPLISTTLPRVSDNVMEVLPLMFTEAIIGLAFGLVIRITVMALQLAGSIAAQSTSLAQIAGAGATPDPMPAIGNTLFMAGLALTMAGGLHVKAALAIAHSYEVLPLGLLAPPGDAAQWGVAHVAHAFALGFTLAAPFIIASLAYYLMLGVINRTMPQLMVTLIGAPAITAGGLFLLLLSAPTLLAVWGEALDAVLADPFGVPR